MAMLPPMTSRERVLAAIAHRQPDRVPIDLGATPSSGISAIAYHNLTRHLGLAGSSTRVYDVVQQLAQPEDTILDHFGVDVIDVGRAFNTRDEDWYSVQLPDGPPVQFPGWFRPLRRTERWDVVDGEGTRIATMPAGATFFDQTCIPYADDYPDDYRDLGKAMGKVHWGALAHGPWDHAREPDFWEQLRERALALRAQSDRALMIVVGCNLFEWGTFLRGLDTFLIDLVTDARSVERLLDALLERHLATLARVCAALGDVVDLIRFGDDLGMDSGPFMNPKLYRALFKPRHKALCDYVRAHSTTMHTFLHSCGSIYRLLPDLIDAGFEVINPVQTTARDMEPERLKAEFGAHVTFWGGGCDTRHVLNGGSPEEVKAHVTRNLEILAPGGGCVFNTVHNILPDVPPENIVAMYEAVAEFNNAAS